MKIDRQPLRPYVAQAPLALALERMYEVSLMRNQNWHHPVLDVGCGDGIFAAITFNEKVDFGIDPNPMELERAATTGKYGELKQETGSKMAFPTGSIGTAFSNSVLEHIPDLDSVLKEVWRVLAPGGMFYVTVPSDKFERYSLVASILRGVGLSGLEQKFSAFYNRFWQHYHCYDANGWIAKFKAAGFKTLKNESYVSPESCRLHDMLVPLAFPSLLSRKFLRRWFFVPSLRAFFSRLFLSAWASTLLDSELTHADGGLLFFALEKPRTDASHA
jgi:SAM-dependent methyltransferase